MILLAKLQTFSFISKKKANKPPFCAQIEFSDKKSPHRKTTFIIWKLND